MQQTADPHIALDVALARLAAAQEERQELMRLIREQARFAEAALYELAHAQANQ